MKSDQIYQQWKKVGWSWSYGSWLYLCNQCLTTNAVSSNPEEFFWSHLPKEKWNKKFTFPSKFLLSRWGQESKPDFLGGLGVCLLLEIFEIFNVFWAYLQGFWCLKINIFFLLCFIDYNQFYSQFVQHWKIYRVNSLIWHTLHKLNVLWTDHGFLELLSGPRHKTTSHSSG
jgi:hypothetical protein